MIKPVTALWFKVLAVGIAVGLGGGDVWKRQQAAATPSAPPLLEVRAQEAQKKPPVLLLSGSKSGAVNFDGTNTVPLRKPLIPSSKSVIVVEPEKEPQPEPQQPNQP